MRWGFAWELGPFEIDGRDWREGLRRAVQKEGRSLPPVLEKVLASGRQGFYESEKGTTTVFDIASGAATKVEEP